MFLPGCDAILDSSIGGHARCRNFFWDHFGWELCNRVFGLRYIIEYIGIFRAIHVLIYTDTNESLNVYCIVN